MNTSSEEYRHQAEVRQVLKWREKQAVKAYRYLNAVQDKRGKEARDRLERDVKRQWELGNRGEPGRWETRIREAA